MLVELRRSGADVDRLRALARAVAGGGSDPLVREELAALLREFGFVKLGQRKAVEAALLDEGVRE